VPLFPEEERGLRPTAVWLCRRLEEVETEVPENEIELQEVSRIPESIPPAIFRVDLAVESDRERPGKNRDESSLESAGTFEREPWNCCAEDPPFARMHLVAAFHGAKS